MSDFYLGEDEYQGNPEEMMCEHRIDVEGAPFRIGQWVQYVERSDKTISTYGLGRVGRVYALDYGLHCGQTYPADPGIRVSGLPHDWYWHDELRALTEEEIARIREDSVLVPIEFVRPQIVQCKESFFTIEPGNSQNEA